MARAEIRVTADGRAQIQAAAGKLRDKAVRAIAKDARRYAPRDTNELAESIEPDTATGRVWVGTDHWAPTEYGSRPHPIPNAWGRGITVAHPGTPQQSFMRPALYTRRDLA